VVTLSVTANIGSNVLSFAASGKSDGLGSDIGNVQLIRQGTTNNIVINGDFSIPNQNGKWKIYNGAINGWSGS
jgi:ABC-type transporter MlaC component